VGLHTDESFVQDEVQNRKFNVHMMTRALTRNENYDPYEFMSHKPSVDRVQSQHHKQSL